MGSPIIHAELSAKRFGGKPEDYLKIHELMDSSKEAMSDLRHRVLTHNSWFVTKILEMIFGPTIENSEGKKISVRLIGQWHVMEDFQGAFPTVQDYVTNFKLQPWMDNGKDGARPPSEEGLPPFDTSLLIPKPRPEPEEFSSDSGFFPRGCGSEGRID